MNTKIVDALIDLFFLSIKLIFFGIIVILIFICALLAGSGGAWCF